MLSTSFTAWFEQTPALTSFYRMVSTNVDRDGREFVSTIEGIDYPVYGVQVSFVDGVLTTTSLKTRFSVPQWHPERPQYEWQPGMDIHHSEDDVEAMQHVANFLGSEIRKK